MTVGCCLVWNERVRKAQQPNRGALAINCAPFRVGCARPAMLPAVAAPLAAREQWLEAYRNFCSTTFLRYQVRCAACRGCTAANAGMHIAQQSAAAAAAPITCVQEVLFIRRLPVDTYELWLAVQTQGGSAAVCASCMRSA